MDNRMVSVDKWSSGSQAYFLTHLHADHTAGLHSTWRRGPLFCSRLSAKLFPCKFPDLDLSLIRILDIGAWHSLSLISPSSGFTTEILVKAIDAQHCPGSVMYLFRGEFGCMLYTGDFRWELNVERVENGRAVLLDALKNVTLDYLYLDNTYCNPRYSFPSRLLILSSLIQIMMLLLELTQLIWVWPERLQIMHLLGFNNNFTTQTALTRVRAIPRYSFSRETLEGLNLRRPTIGVMPSGLPWDLKRNGNTFGSSKSSLKKKDNRNHTSDLGEDSTSATKHIFIVPYSDHSCFSEIKAFIELVRPVNIKGIVSYSSSYIEPSYYFNHLCGTEQAKWRTQQQKLEKEEVIDKTDSVEIDFIAEVTSSVLGKKRKINHVESYAAPRP